MDKKLECGQREHQQDLITNDERYDGIQCKRMMVMKVDGLKSYHKWKRSQLTTLHSALPIVVNAEGKSSTARDSHLD